MTQREMAIQFAQSVVAEPEACSEEIVALARAYLELESLLEPLGRSYEAIKYISDHTYYDAADGQWHFKAGYDPQTALDAIEMAKAWGRQ